MECKNTSNWDHEIFKQNKKYSTKWVDLHNASSPNDTLRVEGMKLGCVSFARGEGIFFSKQSIYFTCTSGGKSRLGQIWKYTINKNNSDTIELIYESSNNINLNMPDNIIVSPQGDIIVCEDGKGRDRLIGINQMEKYILLQVMP